MPFPIEIAGPHIFHCYAESMFRKFREFQRLDPVHRIDDVIAGFQVVADDGQDRIAVTLIHSWGICR
jgi:hypothetical protein